MSRSGFLILLCLALGTVAPVLAQEPARFVSDDGLFSFEYPGTWIQVDSDIAVRLLDPDPAVATADAALLRVDIMYPGSAGIAPGAYAGYSPDEVLNEFQSQLEGLYVFTPIQVATADGKSVAFTTTTGTNSRGRLVNILLTAVDIGGNHVALIYGETPTTDVLAYQQTLLGIAGSMNYTGPPAELPSETPPVVEQPSSPTGETETPAPPAVPADTATAPTEEAPTEAQPPVTEEAPVNERTQATDFGRVVLRYAEGSLLIYNNSDQTVNIDGLVLESPAGDERFTSNDFGGTTKNYFGTDRCIIVHLNTQAVEVPSFCNPGRTRILTYLQGDTSGRYLVWNPGFATASAFVVSQFGETLATCPIAAGECSIEAPVVQFPFEVY